MAAAIFSFVELIAFAIANVLVASGTSEEFISLSATKVVRVFSIRLSRTEASDRVSGPFEPSVTICSEIALANALETEVFSTDPGVSATIVVTVSNNIPIC